MHYRFESINNYLCSKRNAFISFEIYVDRPNWIRSLSTYPPAVCWCCFSSSNHDVSFDHVERKPIPLNTTTVRCCRCARQHPSVGCRTCDGPCDSPGRPQMPSSKLRPIEVDPPSACTPVKTNGTELLDVLFGNACTRFSGRHLKLKFRHISWTQTPRILLESRPFVLILQCPCFCLNSVHSFNRSSKDTLFFFLLRGSSSRIFCLRILLLLDLINDDCHRLPGWFCFDRRRILLFRCFLLGLFCFHDSRYFSNCCRKWNKRFETTIGSNYGISIFMKFTAPFFFCFTKNNCFVSVIVLYILR